MTTSASTTAALIRLVVGDRDEIGSRRVVDDDTTAKCACLGRGQEPLELLPSTSSCETARDEQCDVVVRDAEPLELVENGCERNRTRIDLRAREWERGRLDDDADPSSPSHDLVERSAGERIRERLAHGSCHVDHSGRWRWRTQDHVVRADRDGDDPRAREERDAGHGTGDDSVAS